MKGPLRAPGWSMPSHRVASSIACCCLSWGSLAVSACVVSFAEATQALPADSVAAGPTYDTIIRNGKIYDGSGKPPYVGDVAIGGDRIAYVGPHAPGRGKTELDAHGMALAPGFVNMLAHPEESLLIDGRALSDLRQGVTLEVMGEMSMGPLNAALQKILTEQQTDIHYNIDWHTLGEYLTQLQKTSG
jgi:N-acyl-D-amino-acid deacylase